MADAESSKHAPVKSAAGNKAEGRKSNGASRPAIIPLAYPDAESLQKAYMPFVKGGGLFFPTIHPYKMNEEVFLLVTLPNSKNALPVEGVVVWRTPAEATEARRQGVGIAFKGKEGNRLRNQIEGVLGARIGSSRATFTL